MLTLENFSYFFPQKDLFNKISFTIEPGQHCAFIGTSGSGKSTLLNIIMDPEPYMYSGTLDIDPAWKLGYVSQFPNYDAKDDPTVFEYIAKDFIELQDEITTICTAMETGEDIERLLEEYQVALDRLEAIGGDDYESNIEKKLGLANLSKLRNQKISELSGGEFKLIQVIKEMLFNPDLLIMDEPDVFLDFENLNSLRILMNAFKKTLLIITHNRYLLNNCFNKIIHLENTELQEFDGTFTEYNFMLLEKKIELQELAIADEEEIARNEALIEDLREKATYNTEASRGRALKARVRLNERLKARQIKAPFVDIKKPAINLRTTNEIEETIALKVDNLNVAFDDILLEDVSFEIGSKDKVALIGANGTGKTTLFRAIMNHDHPSINVHDDITIEYLSQTQSEVLKEDHTIREEFFEVGFDSLTAIRRYLRRHGFYDENIDQKISDLSGGEKNILQLAKISATRANMLLLDEPTSHLDTYSQIALEEAIKNYNGAILMISHDYYSIVNCMDYVLIVEDKSIRKMKMKKFKRMIYKRHFDRDYLEYEEKKKAAELAVQEALSKRDFEKAKVLAEKLADIIENM